MSKLTSDTYVATYKDNKNQSGNVKVQTASDESTAKSRYDAAVLKDVDNGYTSQKVEKQSTTVLGDTKASWTGYKLTSVVSGTKDLIMYGYNDHMGQWWTATVTFDVYV